MTKAPEPSITAWFDGVCEPMNPGGHGAYGALVKVNGNLVLREGAYVGSGPQISNNVAEYAGIIAVMRCIEGPQGEGVIYGDSKLAEMQRRERAPRPKTAASVLLTTPICHNP